MPSKVPFCTEVKLKSVPLPNHGGRYAVVPHGFIIDEVKKELANAGFGIVRENYKSTESGEIAQATYQLDYGNDPDMGLMFAWSNSYNKTMRFKCAAGAHVFVCMNGVVRGSMSNYSRKHTGTALQDVENKIQSHVQNAKKHYDILVQDKQMLKSVMLTARDKGRILGELFAKDELLTLTQVGVVKKQMDKPSHTYNCNPDSAWAMYNHITYALKESHPYSYLSDHQRVHNFFVNEYGQLITPQPIEVEEELFMIEQESPEESYGVTFL